MKTRFHRRSARKESQLGFQIAPMIDVVFVILLFFMVAAGNARMENAHTTRLPGEGCGPILLPDEISIQIGSDGQISLNDEFLDAPDAKDLKELAAGMIQLKHASDAAGALLLVTIEAEERAKYQRVVDVLDVLTRAKISDVTFTAAIE